MEVIGVDVDPGKVEAVNAGVAPVPEPGLGELLGQLDGSLRATCSVHDAVLATNVTFITVPTPGGEDGALSLDYLREACDSIGHALRLKPRFHLVAVTSTVMPGATGGALTETIAEASGKRAGDGFAVCYVPEFVALGTAIRDFLGPDFVLIGEADPRSGDLLESLFGRVCENDPPVIHTSLVAAELAKLAVNAFLATKITFANVLAQISEGLPGCDVDAVTSVVGRDSRIGGRYLTGAMAFGGPCLPRDTAALAALAAELGAPAQLTDAALEINGALLDRLAALARAALPSGGSVGVCGLAFKPGTDVVEDSPGAILARRLADSGIPVIAFDPMVAVRDRSGLGHGIDLARSLEECVARSDVVVVASPADSFVNELPALLPAEDGRRRTLIDCWRIVESRPRWAERHIAPGRGANEAVRDHHRVAGAA
jgi:UDPglucose 6-dehydrogenase